jgi:hypothetical protein
MVWVISYVKYLWRIILHVSYYNTHYPQRVAADVRYFFCCLFLLILWASLMLSWAPYTVHTSIFYAWSKLYPQRNKPVCLLSLKEVAGRVEEGGDAPCPHHLALNTIGLKPGVLALSLLAAWWSRISFGTHLTSRITVLYCVAQ